LGIAADISLILIFGLILGAIAHRLGQPMLLGSIAAGVILGPHVAGLSIQDPHEVELLAEIGIALLLFSIGVEFSFDSLRSVRRVAIFGTAIQMSLSWVFGWALGRWLGYPGVEALWLGALISVSSTMVVLKTLAGSGVMGTLSSRVMVGMLIAQDLAVIALMIVLPQIDGSGFDPRSMGLALGRSAIVLIVLVLGGRKLVPWLMRRVVGWGSRELFVLSVITLSLGIGYLSHLFGLSYALGAFVAGLVLSESEYAHQALSDVVPLRDLFGLIFFASVGMLFDPGYLVENFVEVALLVVCVLVVKGLLFGTITRAFGYRLVVPIATALTMGQIGEFSFLLAQLGRQTSAIGENLHSTIVSTAVVTMILTPYLAKGAGPIHRWRTRRGGVPATATVPELVAVRSPIVIAGAGRVGQRIARILHRQKVEFVMIEFDHHRAELAREAGWQVVFGDAAQDPVLEAAGIHQARMALVTVPSAVDSIAVARRVGELAPKIPLVVRTDTLEDIEPLLGREGLRVIQPEFEAAMEMAHEALATLGMDRAEIEPILATERAEKFRS
jgi:CPA2 family monovalent cation:H+ antiporter-2